MNKIVLTALMGLLSASAFADTHFEKTEQVGTESKSKFATKDKKPKYSVFVEKTKHEAAFAEGKIDVDLKGVSFGVSTAPQRSGFSFKMDYLKTDHPLVDAKFVGGNISGQLNLIDTKHFYALGTLGIGYGVASSDQFDSTEYLTLPVGLEMGVNLSKNLSLYAGAGYKWALDLSTDDKILCMDGYLSKDRGDKTCANHYGPNIFFNYDYMTSFHGLTYNAGLRVNF